MLVKGASSNYYLSTQNGHRRANKNNSVTSALSTGLLSAHSDSPHSDPNSGTALSEEHRTFDITFVRPN